MMKKFSICFLYFEQEMLSRDFMKSAPEKILLTSKRFMFLKKVKFFSVTSGFQHFEKTPDLVDCFRGKS